MPQAGGGWMQGEENEYVRALFETFAKISKSIHRKVFNEARFKGKPAQVYLLSKLRRAAKAGDGGMRVSELAAAFGVTASGVTQMVTSLERDGLVCRSMDTEDRRAVRVHLTKSGARAIDSIMDYYGSVFSGLVDHLGRRRAKELCDLMAAAAEYMDGLDPSGVRRDGASKEGGE
jgi:DNA-binding MarR family transcriptional regulator